MSKLSRRDFLKLIGTASIMASLDWSTLIRRAFAEVQNGTISLIWFEAQDCAGDTTSLIQATDPDVLQVLAGLTQIAPPGAVILPYHETIMPEWGAAAVAHLALALGGVYDPYVLILEGAIPPDRDISGIDGSDLFCYVADKATVMEALDKLEMVLEGKLKPDYLLPVLDVVKAINPETYKALLDKVAAKKDAIIKNTEECLKDLGDEDVISCARWYACLMKRAAAVVTLGNCASYGGIVGNTVAFVYGGNSDLYDMYNKASGNYASNYVEKWHKQGWALSPSGGVGFFPDPIRGYKGFAKILYEKGGWYRDAAAPFVRFIEKVEKGDKSYMRVRPGQPDIKPAIAVPGCPSNGNAQLKTLANLILWVKGLLPLPELDKYWRPKFIFGPTVHEQCPRAAWYAAGVMRKYPGEPTAACLFGVGCKGPIANCPYNKVGWVNGVGGPTRTGGVCIGCTMPGFMDAYEPFYKPLPAPEPPKATGTVASIVGAAIVGAAAAYGIGQLHKREVSKSK